MSLLTIYPDDSDPAQHRVYEAYEEIARVAAEAGFRFERWRTEAPLGPDATQDEVLAAYAASVARIKAESGFRQVDVVSMTPSHPKAAEARAKFLDEHTHAEDEARFFVEGAGLFHLHLGKAVYALRCEAGDLISVPMGTLHWFDMGASPSFKCIRFFTDPAGWVAEFSGSTIARSFPGFVPPPPVAAR